MLKKYSKPSYDVKKVNHYREMNEELFKKQYTIDEIYSKQAKRKFCKICQKKLGDNIVLQRNLIDYTLCDNCSHFNGVYEDNIDFNTQIYFTDTIVQYAEKFLNEEIQIYKERVDSIYVPKVEFLIETLLKEKLVPTELTYVDIGTGAGHFIAALKEKNLNSCMAYEISPQQVAYANRHLNEELCKLFDINELESLIKTLDCNVISFIGVLEHLTNPMEILTAIKENPKIEYLYISLPMLSICVLFQTFFQHKNIYERHCAGTHTHLFTKDSINWICKHLDFKIIGEWWFGGDFIDLERQAFVSSPEQSNHLISKYLSPFIDDLQNIIDKHELSSELHAVFKVR